MNEGLLHSINVSSGGVPKYPRERCWVGKEGLDGDRQRDLRHHGGAERAVALYSLQLIDALRAEGHAIAVGSIGENLTLDGLDWTAVVPGASIEVGEVLLQVTGYAAPCENIAGSF